MKLIVISSPTPIENEAALINALFAEGLSLFHLRKPESTEDECFQLIKKIDQHYSSKIVLHQFHHLAEQIETKRIHFPETERLKLSDKKLNDFKAKGFVISTSIHRQEEIENLSESFAYAFIGPVFESLSKPGYKPTEKIALKAKGKTKIIAIGGVTPKNMIELKKNNFDGAAVLGAIWSDPENAIKVFKACKKQYDCK